MRTGLVLAATLLLGASATADPQRWPLSFDPAIAEKPAAIQQLLAAGDADFPELPVSMMRTTQIDQVKLWFWTEMEGVLENVRTSGPGFMTWPQTPVRCVHHAAFAVPNLLLPGAPSPSCQDADAGMRQALADLSACRDVEEPERYVLEYPSADVNSTVTGTIEGLVGLAGEAIHQAPALPEGALPPDFVATMRVILAKIRHDTLTARLSQARSAYTQAITLLDASPACFDATASATLRAAITALVAEVDGAGAYLQDLKATGEAETGRELLRLGARSRARLALPYPSLTWAEREFVAFWIGGIYWRMRGGGLIDGLGTQERRFYFVLRPFQVVGRLAGGQDGFDAANPIWLAVFGGWGEWTDMGRTPGEEDKYYDLVRLTRRGYDQVTGAAEALAAKGYDTTPLIAGGLEMGPCYYYPAELLQSFLYGAFLSSPYRPFIECTGAVGEVCAGGSIALGLVRTLLAGYATGQPPTCTIDCTGRVCGDDHCAGSCGTCPDGTACTPAGQCGDPTASGDGGPAGPDASPPCAPDCAGRQCGDDGCGGSCGVCSGGSACSAGRCGATDGAAATDAGGATVSDGGTALDAGGGLGGSTGSCGCRGGGGAGGHVAALSLLALLGVRRRRSDR